MQKNSYDLIIFLVVVTGLILFMVAFIISIVFLHRKRQQQFEQSLEQTKTDHEKALLSTRLEMQEQTFQHISREIHDNINLSLTLAKLNLNMADLQNIGDTKEKIYHSVDLLTKSIAELSDLSKGLNTTIITRQGLLASIEEEIERIRRTGLFKLQYKVTGEPVYMEAQRELVIFRIIQEAFNNIIRHATAKETILDLYYNAASLYITITDDGRGISTDDTANNKGSGLKNMEARSQLLGGQMTINSQPGKSTTLSFTIPFSITT
jgi:two-component system, NarL family, sensor kinase